MEKGDYNGDVFGSSDKWFGLGVFFDSFDNDNKHNNPYIMAVLNDGTKKFDHQKWVLFFIFFLQSDSYGEINCVIHHKKIIYLLSFHFDNEF